jgi:hypothetical protein
MSRANDDAAGHPGGCIPALTRRSDGPLRERLRAWLAHIDSVNATAAALAAALLVVFSRSPYLPMVDLPQHASQLSMWIHRADPAYPEAAHFEVNWHTPYLTAYAVARAIAFFAGVVPAMKLVVWASALGHYLAFRWLVTLLGYPRWTALLGFVTALGYPFFFGFVSFLAAMPLALACVGAALVHREAPTRLHGVALALVLSATLASHGFAFGLALLFVGPLLLRGAGSVVQRAAPFAPPLVLWLTWILPFGSVRSIGATIWDPRVLELGGLPALFFAASSEDPVAVGLGYATLVALAATFGRPSREPERWAPLAFLIAGFCLFPFMMSGFGPLHPRFAAMLVPALLLAFEPRAEPRAPRRGAQTWMTGPFVAALAAVWFGCLSYRLALWNDEVRPLARVIAALPAHLRVRPVVFDRNSETFPGLPAHLHLTAYYQAEKGGTQGYSFAMYPTSALRYVPGFAIGMASGQEWDPQEFSFEREGAGYDVFLVHSRDDRRFAPLFAGHESDVALTAREGHWRAYRVVSTPHGVNDSS